MKDLKSNNQDIFEAKFPEEVINALLHHHKLWVEFPAFGEIPEVNEPQVSWLNLTWGKPWHFP